MGNIPVIFLTANIEPQTEAKCFKMGAVDFISKPFVPEIIKNRINRTLELEAVLTLISIKVHLIQIIKK